MKPFLEYFGTSIIGTWELPAYQHYVKHFVYEDKFKIDRNEDGSLNVVVELRSRFEAIPEEFPWTSVIATETSFKLNSFEETSDIETQLHDLFNFAYWKHFDVLQNHLKDSAYIGSVNSSRDTVRFTQHIKSEMDKLGLSNSL